MSSDNDADAWKAVAAESEAVLARPDIAGCYAVLQRAYDAGMQHPQILWRLARACYEMGQETTDAAVCASYMKKGLELCQRAVAADDQIAAAHKWLGILISAQHVSTKEKIANAFVIRDHFLKAIELEPHDANALHCMGNWCFSVLQVGWLERKAAALLFATPPTSTYEECLRYLLASAAAGDTVHNAKLLGDVYYQQGNYAEAKQWYAKAIAMPAHSELQKRHRADAEAKLRKC